MLWLQVFCLSPVQMGIIEGDYGASLHVQMVKNLPVMQKTQLQCLGQEDPLEKGMETHSSILAWRIPWTEEPGGLQSTEAQSVRCQLLEQLTLWLSLFKVTKLTLFHYGTMLVGGVWKRDQELQKTWIFVYLFFGFQANRSHIQTICRNVPTSPQDPGL